MIYNYQESKWDFVSNNDVTRFETVWTFNVSDNNTGMISNGDVNYDILSYTNVDGVGLIKAFNTKVKRNMDILIKKMDWVLLFLIKNKGFHIIFSHNGNTSNIRP